MLIGELVLNELLHDFTSFQAVSRCGNKLERSREISSWWKLMKVASINVWWRVVFLFGMTIIMEFWPLTIVAYCSKSWSFATKSCLTVRRRTFYTWQRVLEMRTADCISDSNTTCDDFQLFFIHLKLKSAHVWLQLFLYYVFHFQTSSNSKERIYTKRSMKSEMTRFFFRPNKSQCF